MGGALSLFPRLSLFLVFSRTDWPFAFVLVQIPDLGSGQYRLTARGQGGVNFENGTDLQYVHKSYSVFVQTDKAIYKPGHTVQFRVLALNANLKPSVTQPLDIFISVCLTFHLKFVLRQGFFCETYKA